MVRCQEGHFYDPGKYPGCPWCDSAPKAGPPKLSPALKSPRTYPPTAVPVGPAAVINPSVAPSVVQRDTPPGALNTGSFPPVIGWLVCLEGPDQGRDFRLKAEKNVIGRSSIMDVCIPSDTAISREKHASLIFDPKKQIFWLLPGDSAGLVYHNGEAVNSPVQVHGDDVIELGRSKLVLVPFCGEKYRW